VTVEALLDPGDSEYTTGIIFFDIFDSVPPRLERKDVFVVYDSGSPYSFVLESMVIPLKLNLDPKKYVRMNKEHDFEIASSTQRATHSVVFKAE